MVKTSRENRLNRFQSGSGIKPKGSRGTVPFDLRGLEVFLVVAETRGFTKAAKRLRLTQPAISQVISQLEIGLGAELIDRKVKPIALTIAGATLRDKAAGLLEAARSIVPAIREVAASKVPSLRVGMVDSLFTTLAPALGVELRSSVDQLSIILGQTGAHRQAFLNRELDVIITADAIEDIDGLDRITLIEEPFVVILPSRWNRREPIDLGQLAGELPFVRFADHSSMGRQIELYLRRIRVKIPVSQAFGSTSGVVQIVAARLGWSIITPLCMLDMLPLCAQTYCAPLPSPGMSRRITLVSRSQEMGNLPDRLGKLAVDVLQKNCLPKIVRIMPWVKDKITIG